MSTQESAAALATTAEHLLAAKLYSLASCVMLFYDIAITFGDEVEKIWKQRFTGATVLWFINRYTSPLGYIVVIVAFNDPNWGQSACNRYVLYPEALKIVTAAAVGVIFILRLYSIYARSRTILITFILLLLAELGVKIWAFTGGTSLQLPPGLIGCILTAKGNPAKRFIFSWVAELCFDSVVFFATLYRTLILYRTIHIKSARSLVTVIMRDGIMYFAAIFISNLITVLFLVLATADLKAVNASFSTLITSLMTSRLMLNLRTESLRRGTIYQVDQHATKPSFRPYNDSRTESEDGRSALPAMQVETFCEQKTTFEASLIGNLGAPLMWSDDEDDEPAWARARGDMEMQPRGPVSVKVQVEEEVVVEAEAEPAALTRVASVAHFPLRAQQQPPGAYSPRRPWTAPPAWRLSRDRDRQRGLMQDIYRTS